MTKKELFIEKNKIFLHDGEKYIEDDSKNDEFINQLNEVIRDELATVLNKLDGYMESGAGILCVSLIDLTEAIKSKLLEK